MKLSTSYSSKALVISDCNAAASLALASSIVVPCKIPLRCSQIDWEYSHKHWIVLATCPVEFGLQLVLIQSKMYCLMVFKSHLRLLDKKILEYDINKGLPMEYWKIFIYIEREIKHGYLVYRV